MRKRNYRVLGIDLASRTTGYALVNKGKLYKKFYGTIKIPPKQSINKRLFDFSLELKSLIERAESQHGLDLIVVESSPMRNNFKTSNILAMFEAMARFILYSLYGDATDTKVEFVGATTIRAQLKFPKEKERVFELIQKRFKLNELSFNKDHDITDAIAIALYGCKVGK